MGVTFLAQGNNFDRVPNSRMIAKVQLNDNSVKVHECSMDDFQNYIRNLTLRSGHPKTKQICLMHFICFMIKKKTTKV